MKTWWQREVDWTRMQRDPMPSPYRKLWATTGAALLFALDQRDSGFRFTRLTAKLLIERRRPSFQSTSTASATAALNSFLNFLTH